MRRSPAARVRVKKRKGSLFQAQEGLSRVQVKHCSITVPYVAEVTQHHRFNTVASSLSEDVSEDEQSVEDFEEERENGNHIPAGG